jgi:DUF2934 family protein
MAADLDIRIRQRAYEMWRQEGRPEGKAERHWELAKFAISLEDAQPEMLKPIASPKSEPIEAWVNQGEFPTLTDQGEQTVPGQSADDR